MKTILVINGPSLNLLGTREPNIYGNKTYDDLKSLLKSYAKSKKINIVIKQTSYEGKIIDEIIRGFKKKYLGIILNPGAYTHYSYSIRDVIKAVNIKIVEVHLSNINSREDFRKLSVISDVVSKTFMGEHFNSYIKAIDYIQNN